MGQQISRYLIGPPDIEMARVHERIKQLESKVCRLSKLSELTIPMKPAAQSQTSALVKLPAEIVDHIVSYLWDDDIRNVRLASAEIAGKSTKAFAETCFNRGFYIYMTMGIIPASNCASFSQHIRTIDLYAHHSRPFGSVLSRTGSETGRALSRLSNLCVFSLDVLDGSVNRMFVNDLLLNLHLPKLHTFEIIDVDIGAESLRLFISNHQHLLEHVGLCSPIIQGSFRSVLNAISGIRKPCVVKMMCPREGEIVIVFDISEDDPDVDYVSVEDCEEEIGSNNVSMFEHTICSTPDPPDGLVRGVACLERNLASIPRDVPDEDDEDDEAEDGEVDEDEENKGPLEEEMEVLEEDMEALGGLMEGMRDRMDRWQERMEGL